MQLYDDVKVHQYLFLRNDLRTINVQQKWYDIWFPRLIMTSDWFDFMVPLFLGGNLPDKSAGNCYRDWICVVGTITEPTLAIEVVWDVLTHRLLHSKGTPKPLVVWLITWLTDFWGNHLGTQTRSRHVRNACRAPRSESRRYWAKTCQRWHNLQRLNTWSFPLGSKKYLDSIYIYTFIHSFIYWFIYLFMYLFIFIPTAHSHIVDDFFTPKGRPSEHPNSAQWCPGVPAENVEPGRREDKLARLSGKKLRALDEPWKNHRQKMLALWYLGENQQLHQGFKQWNLPTIDGKRA